MNPAAQNYDETATDNDGTCEITMEHVKLLVVMIQQLQIELVKMLRMVVT